jgi:hypothetical protein
MSFRGPPRQCHLCQQLFLPGDAIFRTPGEVFPEGDPCHGFYFVDLHWECFARWPHQERFAATLFARACSHAQDNPSWGIGACTEHALLTINVNQHAGYLEVVIARTGARYRINLEEWSRWLEAPPAAHALEREALEEALGPLRSTLSSPGRVLEQASWPGREKALARQQEEAALLRQRRQAYRLARRQAALAAQEGQRCPTCGVIRQDHAFHDGASRRGLSFFVCAACGGQFSAT